ncbi:sugar-specific transcriptional regulator TrmB/DNA-binding CsgD family transcriptional regulator [Kitasatospora sp. MAA19]|uniref:helix-turn-helix transcriptional regulator n=1 Tax=Kitasatospora sp. MAA19 TaxID=3035090 RepID=UPI002473B616|nr:LuxR family transcriptional regulator [Kitasatospora sp. MAA19]MDH6707267.1 sugar-specific transcriptional regulator TrmB/DNA-binding CsgD family transcriptional regulator [Kitasatospora sp. MAA19]
MTDGLPAQGRRRLGREWGCPVPESGAGRFAGLGLDAAEEELYLRLLSDGGASARQLGARCGLAAERAAAVLESLVAQGLVERPSPGREQWTAAAPDVALEELLLRREVELRRARGRINELMRTYRRSPAEAGMAELVEVITGRGAIAELWRSLQLGVREQVRVLDKPPYVRRSDPETELALLGRGVEMRAVYESRVLREPERTAEIRSFIRLGERARVLPELPLKLAVVDARWALLPVSAGTELEHVLLVRPSSLLDALIGLFELHWSHAMHFPAPDTADEPEDRHHRLLALLASGLTDESIARQLVVSTRTVQRWVRELMDRFGARTRFQAGIQAARADLL